MEENTKMKVRKILNYLKYIALSLIILFIGLLIIPVLCSAVFKEVLMFLDPATLYALVIAGPWSLYSWLILFSWIIVTLWSFVAFIVWVVRDSRKFVAQGVRTSPLLWGVGMIFPIILVTFPVYFVCRNIMWQKEDKKLVLIKLNSVQKIFLSTVLSILAIFFIATVLRTGYVSRYTAEQVAKIHATKLTMDDVMGKNLPPDPGAEADKTVAGVDANENGIRDDVELAIFKEYPNSAKTRAVLLQYALVLQMEVVQPFENERNVTAVAEDGERAYACVGEIVSRDDIKKYSDTVVILRGFVENRQLNNEARKKAQRSFYESLGSHTMPRETCDLDISTLPN